MLKGFKEFILRGNVVELATAVIIGAAFTAIVTAFTTHIIAPLLAAIPSGEGCGQTVATGEDSSQAAVVQVCGLAKEVRAGNPATLIDFGAVISAGINFVIVAAVVYFLIIVPYNKLNELSSLNKDDDADTEVDLLGEIRDLLKQRSGGAAPVAAAPAGYAAPAPGYQSPVSGYPSADYPGPGATYANPPTPDPAPGQYPPADGPRHGR